MTGPAINDHGRVGSMPRAYAVAADGPCATPVVGRLPDSWAPQVLRSLLCTAPYLVGDPDTAAAALLTAMASGVDGLDDSRMQNDQVVVALGELASACEAALWLATGEGPQ